MIQLIVARHDFNVDSSSSIGRGCVDSSSGDGRGRAALVGFFGRGGAGLTLLLPLLFCLPLCRSILLEGCPFSVGPVLVEFTRVLPGA